MGYPKSFLSRIYHYDKCMKFESKEVINNLLKLVAIDLKMGGQFDRHQKNIMFKISKETQDFSLCPGYDYGGSYPSKEQAESIYYNPFLCVRRSPISLLTLVMEHPIIKEYIDVLINTCMEEIIADIEGEFAVKFDDVEKKDFIIKDKELTRTLKRI